MTSNKFRAVLLGCAAVALLGACTGADGVASPGVGAFVPPPAPPPAAPPPPTTTPPPSTGGPAADCPAGGFSNVGIIANQRICQLPSTITGNLVVPEREGTIYSVAGQTRVGIDLGRDVNNPAPGGAQGVLTIEPGVTIFGNSGLDYIVINRGSLIFAEGEPDKPIIMTSRQGVNGTATENSIGQWGGLVINGRAPTTDGCPIGVTPPNASCEAQVEGSNAFYGGNAPADNSGRIRYLRLMYSGFEIEPDNELNGITLASVGSGTVFEYVQVHNSSDDGIEIFGGNVNLKYIVITGSDDDQFDTDSGWRGAAQFGITYQRTAGGDFGFETSSRGSGTSAAFFTRPTYANWTVVQRSQNTGSGQRRAGIVHNTGHVGQVFNSVVTAENGVECLRIASNATLEYANNFGGNGPVYRSVFMSCGGGSALGTAPITNAQAEAILDTNANNVKNGTSTLISGFINGANENAVPATDITAIAGNTLPVAVRDFLTPVDYIGAVRDANDTWYQGWTCGLPTTPAC